MANTPPNQEKPLSQAGDRRFQLLVDAVKDYAIYLLDADGLVSSWNTGAQRFKGYAADEIIGQHFSRFYTEEDQAAGLPARALRIAVEEGKFEAEGWRVRKDGSRFWCSVLIDPVLDEDGSLIGYAKITRDVTESAEAQQALQESEQRFRMLVQGVHDYAIYMLDIDGRVTNWNTGAERIKGYKVGEIVGQHFSRFYVEEDRDSGEPARALATAIREGKYEKEGWRCRKDGSRFWASVVIDPIRDEHGRLLGFAKITRDITEKRLAQQELDGAREALAQAQKMEAVGRLTGGVAHDFNNLLTVIRSSVDLLRRPGIGEDKRDRYLTAIADTADRAARLTGQLLAFARRQPLQSELFAVTKRIDRLKQIVASLVGGPIALSFEVAEDAGSVNADPSQFETAILNMVINARDAMPNGGTLAISARKADRAPGPSGLAAPGPFVAISIADSGLGMDADTVGRIFEPFFTTKEPGKGTGLGLSQVYGFAKQSGGEIHVSSRAGEGTNFTLYLPQAADAGAEEEADEEPVAEGPAALPARSVLVVEDNESVGEFATNLLVELGHEVRWATDAAAAIAMIEEAPDAFDLVFSDVVMPGANGIDLAKEIRARWPDLPVVLTSGYSHVLAEEGSHGFELLKKPYSIDELTSILRSRARRAGTSA
jgi:PAS domain S-box-containing protein